ncbi:DUF997 family protein [Shewanella algidipiscicola]|uniref:DUF997 family protein n=1 Tax=Shewanella algidipiscicola TaxID=614070 RepID=UPI000D788C7C|nr:DUF997 family protein [Shewanella algidipiscicola]
MVSLSKTALVLTLGYLLLWCAGPLLLQEAGTWAGLPLWFWFSCIAAPLLLILVLVLTMSVVDDD